MKRYQQHEVDDEGWTEWFVPARGYKMRCCDCGLVHEVDLRVKRGEIQMRARRNERATAASRASKKRAHESDCASIAVDLSDMGPCDCGADE